MKLFDMLFRRNKQNEPSSISDPCAKVGSSRPGAPGTASTDRERAAPTSATNRRPLDFDWTSSAAHRLLLTRFLAAQTTADAAPAYWDGVLGEPGQVAIDRFLSLGLLVPAGLKSKLQSSSASELKELVRERGLKVSGTKEVLIDRLIAADPTWCLAHTAALQMIECSAEGRVIASREAENERALKASAIATTFSALRAGDVSSAVAEVARYEAGRVFPRGMGIDWTRPNPAYLLDTLRTILTARPAILKGMAEEKWEPLRLAAAMMELWGTNTARDWLPPGFLAVDRFDDSTAARMLIFHAAFHRDLAGFRKIQVTRVRMQSSDDSCAACKQAAGSFVAIGRVGELPHPLCTHVMGCRCDLVPDL